MQTSANQYKLYPFSNADLMNTLIETGNHNGKFFTASGRYTAGAAVLTASPTFYWLRSPGDYDNNRGSQIRTSDGWWDGNLVSLSYGFRLTGVLNLEGAQCLLIANISLINITPHFDKSVMRGNI